MILIYDGNNLAYRCNSVTELSTRDGKRTSAIYGVLTSIKSNVEELEKATGVGVDEIYFAWDYGRAEWRKALFPDYKAGRGDKERTEEDKIWYEQFIQQVNEIHDFLPYFGVKSIRVFGWEADDLIYGIINKLSVNKDYDLVIISTDKDYLQLIDDNVTVYHPMKKEFWNNMNFPVKFGIPHSGFLMYKCLLGDSSDSIPGINGIGDVNAKKLVNQYRSFNGLLANRAELEKSKRTKAIFDNWNILERNVQLMDLRKVDCGIIDLLLDELIETEVVFDEDKVMAILKENQLVSILTKFKDFSKAFNR